MKKYSFFLLLLCYGSVCISCQKDVTESADTDTDTLIFEPPVVTPVIPLVTEISGIAASKINSGYIWAQEDSGNPPELILLNREGAVLKRIILKNATNRDWEDIAIAGDQAYIGDIGDNNLAYPDYTIYQFSEPNSSVNTIEDYKTIRFKYPDGAHDAEAFLVDPVKKDIYIITKRDNPSKVYKLKYPVSYTSMNTASYVGSLKYSGVVSATLSTDTRNIIVKTYMGLNLYQRKNNEEMAATLSGVFTSLPYSLEPQGEAVAFAADNSGYYTLSEKGLSNSVNLYFYRKK